MDDLKQSTRAPGLALTTTTMCIAWTLGIVGVLLFVGGQGVVAALVIVAAAILQSGSMIAEAINRKR